MPKDNIGSIFEKNRNIFSYQESRDFIEPRTIIGVEVELEGMHEASGFARNGIPRRFADEGIEDSVTIATIMVCNLVQVIGM